MGLSPTIFHQGSGMGNTPNPNILQTKHTTKQKFFSTRKQSVVQNNRLKGSFKFKYIFLEKQKTLWCPRLVCFWFSSSPFHSANVSPKTQPRNRSKCESLTNFWHVFCLLLSTPSSFYTKTGLSSIRWTWPIFLSLKTTWFKLHMNERK